MPRLTVVIPVRGRHEVLRRALDRLDRQDSGPDAFEVLVVVDAADESPGRVAELLDRRPYPVVDLVAPRPGASAARNLGWQTAKTPLVLFLGADILAARDLVSQHLAWHTREPADEIGVLGHVCWARHLRVTPFMRWLHDGFQFDYGGIEGTEAAAGNFYTANVSLKRSILARVGGFDEDLPFLYEDLDLGNRLVNAGFKLRYNRDARAEHHHEVTLESWKERVAQIAEAELRFVAKHPDLEPYFHNRFTWALQRPPARGRGLRLAPFVPRRLPVLGPYVWKSVDARYRQELAPAFLEAWERAEAAPATQR